MWRDERDAAPAVPAVLLSQRLALILAATLLLALAASVLLADLFFGQLQHREAVGLVERELARVQLVLRSAALGEEFLTDSSGRIQLQFVSVNGRVQIPIAGAPPLPLHGAPTRVQVEEAPVLVASVPWITPSGTVTGTIRLALDLRAADAARAALRLSLLLSGALIAALALLVALVWLRRSMTPLLSLARMAGEIDPAAPRLAGYEGPNDEVAQVARGLDRAVEAIAQHQQAERDALAEIAHELAGPLSVVAGQLRALSSAHPGDARLLAARAAADELLHTSQDLLLLARGELEREGDLASVDVAEVAAQVAAEYPGVDVERPEEALNVLADRSRMRQVVRNLIRNAVQAVGDGQGVTVRCSADDRHVRVEVVDSGPGIDEAERSRVFDRYYSRRSGRGAGIGLAVVKRVVESFDGTVAVHSRPGSGTSFLVTLPSFASRLEAEGGGQGSVAS